MVMVSTIYLWIRDFQISPQISYDIQIMIWLVYYWRRNNPVFTTRFHVGKPLKRLYRKFRFFSPRFKPWVTVYDVNGNGFNHLFVIYIDTKLKKGRYSLYT
jgi:hypothetical protein